MSKMIAAEFERGSVKLLD